MWKDVDDSLSLPVARVWLRGCMAEIMGRLPEGNNSVLLASDGFVNGAASKGAYMSALEASCSGRTLLTVAEHRGMASVIRGAEACGGEIHIFSSRSFAEYRKIARGYIQAALVSGGSVVCCPDREKAWDLALSFSSLFLGSVTARSQVLERALDRGVDVALLRSSLAFRWGRRYLEEGCPVVDSYSSLFRFPDAVAYETETGEYGFRGSFFSIMRLK